jgi:hypothetical protein
MSQLSEEGRLTLIGHELAHIARRDHWVRWLELIVVTMFWWHPIAWLARWRIHELEDQCCDTWVVRTLPQAARTYARAIIKTVDFLAETQPTLPPAASGLGTMYSLKRRLKMILRDRLHPYRMSWLAWAGTVLFALLMLPASPGSTSAQVPDDRGAALTVSGEEESPPASSNSYQDLDRRMKDLEKKMDRVLQALERSGKPAAASETGKEAESEEAKRRMEEAKQRAKEARDRARARAEQAKERARQHALDAERRAQLHTQIEQTIRHSINPERLQELGREIEQAVNKTVNPERMEALGKQIEEAVNKALSPQRLEAMERQIEEAVNRAVRADDLGKAKREKSKREESSGRGQTTKTEGDSRDLQRRMDKLEEKMNRVLQALENTKPSGS